MVKQIDILREYMVEEHYIKAEALLKQIKDKGYIGDQHKNGWISCSCIKQQLRKKYNIHIEVHVDRFNNCDTYYLCYASQGLLIIYIKKDLNPMKNEKSMV